MTASATPARPVKLHLGGWDAKPGWTIVNVEDRPGVDVRGNVTDLSMFADGSVDEIYASHVYEHLSYQDELIQAMNEAARVLKAGGVFKVAVPDLDTICELFLRARGDLNLRFYLQRVMMGGQIEPYDFHKTSFSEDILTHILAAHGFRNMKRVRSFGLFDDTSDLVVAGVPISLNIECVRDASARPVPIQKPRP